MDNKNARLGMTLFALYVAFYSGFVLLNTFAADVMAQTPVAGLNIAILYGFGLIIGAFILAVIYGMLCKDDDEENEEVQA